LRDFFVNADTGSPFFGLLQFRVSGQSGPPSCHTFIRAVVVNSTRTLLRGVTSHLSEGSLILSTVTLRFCQFGLGLASVGRVRQLNRNPLRCSFRSWLRQCSLPFAGPSVVFFVVRRQFDCRRLSGLELSNYIYCVVVTVTDSLDLLLSFLSRGIVRFSLFRCYFLQLIYCFVKLQATPWTHSVTVVNRPTTGSSRERLAFSVLGI
jgi:hypothetical protein